jgi:type III restriction enzyme
VSSVSGDDNVNDAFVRLIKVDAQKMNAQIEINTGSGANVTQKKLLVKHRDYVFVKSGERQEYRDGYVVESISFEARNQFMEFGNGNQVKVGQALGGFDDDATNELIKREKEKLLSFEDPLRFIFSHSALREGWDNPKVLQILCQRLAD